ncbi:Hypothetical leucine rich repeat protein [Ectocarpus siliculosus]|uniref:Hypothetical leucine rich repeat protein n=1 Tax=Ectocarpus siliculosus TaxID=2880 RepID=D7FM12_ECTSI|nr:Hypothetical leucine rich repeat protein [Ectocarpus siliculosus]|eukprot:CBJ29837.1 Hypothetical leucine rich repeat protein [Ectocarpus siliculosus]
MLRKGFGELEESSSAGGGDGAETDDHSGAPATRGRKCVLRGLAVCSAAVQDQAIARALELHGEGLQVLDLAGCRGLDASLTMEAVRSRCKRLVALDLSGGRSFEGRGRGEMGCAPSVAVPRCAVGGTSFEREVGLGLSRRHPSCSPSVASLSIPDNTHHRLHDYHLVSLLTGLGGRLLSLQLRDRPFITDEGIGAIAVACTQLQELDIGRRTGDTGNRMMRTGSITGQALATLSAAPCAPLLVCLGLRNRHCVGNMDLRALGTHFPSLRRLDLAGLVKVDDDVLRALASTLSLTHIDISRFHGNIRDVLDRHHPESRCPRHAHTANPRLPTHGAPQPGLVRHRAHRVSVSGVSALAVGSPELACISLHGTALADGAVRALCDACPRLRHINLSLTRVTERSLRLLAMKDSLRWVNVRCCSGIGNDAVTAKILANFRSRLSPPKHPRDRGTVLGMERPEPQSRTRAPSCSRRKPLGANSSGRSEDSSGCGGYQGERGKGRREAAIRQEGNGHELVAEEASAIQATAAEEEAVPSLAGEPAGASSRDHPPRPPPPPPLLPAGVGDLSLGRHRRRGGSGSSSMREGTKGGGGSGGTGSQDGGRGFAKGRGGGGERRVEEEAVVPFDWDTVPRGSGVGVLGSWKGFRGLSGDLVKNIIRELHPHAQVEFRPESDFLFGPHSRKNTHGYLVHTSKFGQAWVEFEVDGQGCVT